MGTPLVLMACAILRFAALRTLIQQGYVATSILPHMGDPDKTGHVYGCALVLSVCMVQSRT